MRTQRRHTSERVVLSKNATQKHTQENVKYEIVSALCKHHLINVSQSAGFRGAIGMDIAFPL